MDVSEKALQDALASIKLLKEESEKHMEILKDYQQKVLSVEDTVRAALSRLQLKDSSQQEKEGDCKEESVSSRVEKLPVPPPPAELKSAVPEPTLATPHKKEKEDEFASSDYVNLDVSEESSSSESDSEGDEGGSSDEESDESVGKLESTKKRPQVKSKPKSPLLNARLRSASAHQFSVSVPPPPPPGANDGINSTPSPSAGGSPPSRSAVISAKGGAGKKWIQTLAASKVEERKKVETQKKETYNSVVSKPAE